MEFKKGDEVYHSFSGIGVVDTVDGGSSYVNFKVKGYKKVHTSHLSHLNEKKEEHDKIKLMLMSGIKYAEISRIFGLSEDFVSHLSKQFGINPKEIRDKKVLEILDKVKKAVEDNVPYSEIKKKFKLTSENLRDFNSVGYSLTRSFRNKRDKKMSKKYKNGDTALYLTTQKYNELDSIGSVYNVVSNKMGIYKFPGIKRRCKGLFENKKVIKLILKYRGKNMSFEKIANKLNKKGFRTVTGVKYTWHGVYQKYIKIMKKNINITKINPK